MSKPFTHLCHVCGNGIPHAANSVGKIVSCPYCAADTELGKAYPAATAGYTNPWDQTLVPATSPAAPVHFPPTGSLAAGNAGTYVGSPPPLPKKSRPGPWGSLTGLGLGLVSGGLAAIGILFLVFLMVRIGWPLVAKANMDEGWWVVLSVFGPFLFWPAVLIVLFVAAAVGVAVFKFFVVVGVGTDIARGAEDRKNVGLAGLGFFVAVAAGFLIYKQFFVSFAFMMACVGGLLGLTQWFLNARTLRTPEGVFCLFVVSANLVLCFLSF